MFYVWSFLLECGVFFVGIWGVFLSKCSVFLVGIFFDFDSFVEIFETYLLQVLHICNVLYPYGLPEVVQLNFQEPQVTITFKKM
jgi:hypothetical protein